ncbi:UNVERIFIED_CONTAM: hypothetical protein GTU68_062193 [Idotea baltica]|nr:hypothetical protein [Idotea baltica]
MNATDLGCEPDCFSDLWNASATPKPYIPHTERPEIYLVPILFALIFLVGSVSRRPVTTHSALTSIAVIWVASGGLSLPAAVLSSVRHFPISPEESIPVCTPYPEWLGEFYPKIIVATKTSIYYVIPLTVIASFYCLMARHLEATTMAIPGEATQQSHRVTQMIARRKVAKMVLAFVYIFAICFMPNHVFLMWFYFNPSAKEDFNYFWNAFRIIGFCLGFVNSCINPVALYCISGTFRKYYNLHLFCHTCGSTLTDRSLTRLRFHSSAAGLTSRTDQIDMSTFNGPEKYHV